MVTRIILALFSLVIATAGQMTNADIVKLLGAGLSEAVVIQTIDAANPPMFDTTVDGLIALKKAGASDAVIQRIIERQSGKLQSVASARPAQSVGDCKIEAPGPSRMIRASGKLISMTYQNAKADQRMGGLIGNFFTAGVAKVKSRMTLRIDKDRSSLRITDRQPEFLDILYHVGASPDNLYVVRLTVKDNARFVVVGSSEANIVGASVTSWVMPDDTRVAMSADTLSSQCEWGGKSYSHYRIRPTSPVENGEYAFLQGGTDGRPIMFDFGVD